MKEKEKAVAGVQVAINKQREKQEHLRQELEHIRSLQPKVSWGGESGCGGGMCVCVVRVIRGRSGRWERER